MLICLLCPILYASAPSLAATHPTQTTALCESYILCCAKDGR